MESVFFVKLFLSIFTVLVLSLVVDHAGPRVAGILSGYPIGAAIALFFYGVEIGPEFAARSAIYTLAGLVATQFFVYFYYKSSLWFGKFRVAICSLAAVSGFFLVAWLLHFIELNRFFATLIPVVSVFVFIGLFREIENAGAGNRIRMTPKILVFRAVVSAGLILVVTGTAKWAGERWAGLFSAFPVTLFPLILIVHLTYGTGHVHTIIKNFPVGLGSLIVYCLTVSFAYPALGIYSGTLVSFIAATAYLGVYVFFRGRVG